MAVYDSVSGYGHDVPVWCYPKSCPLSFTWPCGLDGAAVTGQVLPGVRSASLALEIQAERVLKKQPKTYKKRHQFWVQILDKSPATTKCSALFGAGTRSQKRVHQHRQSLPAGRQCSGACFAHGVLEPIMGGSCSHCSGNARSMTTARFRMHTTWIAEPATMRMPKPNFTRLHQQRIAMMLNQRPWPGRTARTCMQRRCTAKTLVDWPTSW